MTKVIEWLRSCVKGRAGATPPEACSEINDLLCKVYVSSACLSLEVQALYTMNFLVRELILEGMQPGLRHVEAIVATLLAWGRIRGSLNLLKESKEGVEALKELLMTEIDGRKGRMVLKDYALSGSILDLAGDQGVLEGEFKRVYKVFDRVNRNTATWEYKTIHFVFPSIFPPYDNAVASALYKKNVLNIKHYVGYLGCLKFLAEWYLDKCYGGARFELVRGFGYAYRLAVDFGGEASLRLYLPLTRLLDFVVWSQATKKNGETLYSYLVGVCTG